MVITYASRTSVQRPTEHAIIASGARSMWQHQTTAAAGCRLKSACTKSRTGTATSMQVESKATVFVSASAQPTLPSKVESAWTVAHCKEKKHEESSEHRERERKKEKREKWKSREKKLPYIDQ